jgi:radical SAM superfamily enzyme YgiQ (UPF0313 family)
MKILLVSPPAQNMITTNIPSVVDEERGISPPLGLLYVAAYARQKTSHTLEVLDCQAENVEHDALEERIRRSSPDVVGIQAMTFTWIDARLAAEAAKRACPSCKVVLGGPHAHIYPLESLSLPCVDFVIQGEGELPFVRLLSALEGECTFSDVDGLAWRDVATGEPRRNLPAKPLEDLDSLPFPARDLTPIHKYYSLLAHHNPITTLFSSRGCPYRCLFCDRPAMGRRFRPHSAPRVVDELEACQKMGIREFFFYDDTFNVNRQRVLDICSEIRRRRLEVTFDIRARVDRMDEEMLKALREAGCERIHYGVESADEGVLQTLRKDIHLDQVRNVFKATRKNGMKTLAYFMIGCPGEDRAKALKSIRFAKELDPDFVHFSVLTPFPATPLYQMGLEQGRFKTDYWADFARHPEKGFQPPLWEEKMRREELIELLRYAYKSFYLRPTVVWRNLSVRSPMEFIRKARAGLKLFRV